MVKLNLSDIDIVPINETFVGKNNEPISKEFFVRLLYIQYVRAIANINRYGNDSYCEDEFKYFLNQIDMSKEDGVLIGMMDFNFSNNTRYTESDYLLEYTPVSEEPTEKEEKENQEE